VPDCTAQAVIKNGKEEGVLQIYFKVERSSKVLGGDINEKMHLHFHISFGSSG
jgi:hypothetical protein